jgi:hypothetical protein
MGTGVTFGVAHRTGTSCDGGCPVALGYSSRCICATFPVLFRANVNCRVCICARARHAGVAVATTRVVAAVRAAQHVAEPASARVHTGLDRLSCGGLSHVVYHA